jgi:phage N-6-adenine-methyltransferase
MALSGFKAKSHPQQHQFLCGSTEADDRALPKAVFAELHARFRFTVDAAASIANAKLPRFWTEHENGLLKSWARERIYCNPPFSDIRPWIEKAWHEPLAELVVMLLPANRTEQGWWQDLVEPRRDRSHASKELGILRTEFLAGRQRFIKPTKSEVGPNERPPFGCVLLIWNWSVANE